MLAAGYTEDELVKTERPLLMADLFDWFCDLRTARKHNGYSLMAIEYSEMQAYFSMRGISVEKWQIDVIRMLDSLSLDAHRESK